MHGCGAVQRLARREILACLLLYSTLASLLALSVWGTPSHAAAAGSIRGSVQRDGQGFAEQRIMLIRFGPNQDVQRFPGQTDATGQFLFENLETGPTWQYFVGIRYAEQLYRSEPITLLDDQPAEVVLKVGAAGTPDTTGKSDPTGLRIMNHLVVIVGREAHLDVREVLRITGPGVEAATPRTGGHPAPGLTLHLPLPQGYTQLSPVQGLSAEAIRTDAAGISYRGPLAPGEHQIVYTYRLPWARQVMTILLERTLSTSALDVLVEDEQLHAASDVPFGGPVAVDPHVFAHFRGANLGANSRSWLQITPRQTTLSWLSITAYGLVIGLGLWGVALPLRARWSRQQVSPSDNAVPQHVALLDTQKLVHNILSSMVVLDDQYAAGVLDETTYQQRRRAAMASLASMLEQWQRVQADCKKEPV